MPYLTPERVSELPRFTPDQPMKVLFSACLTGTPCGVDGTAYGEYPKVLELMRLPNVRWVQFCPEDFSFGTPRAMPDIHGGNGYDVLDGRARVLTDTDEDWTDGFIAGAQEMARRAEAAAIDLAILQNMSAACGSQVISEGCRFDDPRRFQEGPGVASGLLLREGFTVVNALDHRTLELLHHALDPSYAIDAAQINYDDAEWYAEHFGEPRFGRG